MCNILLTFHSFCPGVVSSEMFDSKQNAEIISTLTKEFNEVRKDQKDSQT